MLPHFRSKARKQGAALVLVCLGVASLTARLCAQQPSAPAERAAPTKSMLSVFHDGGPLMYPIAVCSFVLTVFIFERLVALRRGRVIPRPFVKRVLEQL